jgi:Ni,Fe-hydrogenase I cytochrome b subunit
MLHSWNNLAILTQNIALGLAVEVRIHYILRKVVIQFCTRCGWPNAEWFTKKPIHWLLIVHQQLAKHVSMVLRRRLKTSSGAISKMMWGSDNFKECPERSIVWQFPEIFQKSCKNGSVSV